MPPGFRLVPNLAPTFHTLMCQRKAVDPNETLNCWFVSLRSHLSSDERTLCSLPIPNCTAPVLLLLPAFISHDDDDNGLLPAGRS